MLLFSCHDWSFVDILTNFCYNINKDVSRLGPLPPLLEEDFEDDVYDEQQRESCTSSNFGSPGTSSSLMNGSTLRARHEVRNFQGVIIVFNFKEKAQLPQLFRLFLKTGLRDNSFLLARLATMYARSSISPLKILRDLWLKKRYFRVP